MFGVIFFFSSRRRHTRCALVTGVQTCALPIWGIDWICISPKAGSEVVQRSGHELKLVWPQPGSDVEVLEKWAFDHFLIQPLDDQNAKANHQAAIDFVLARPKWRLSLQAHKYLGLR